MPRDIIQPKQYLMLLVAQEKFSLFKLLGNSAAIERWEGFEKALTEYPEIEADRLAKLLIGKKLKPIIMFQCSDSRSI